MERQNEQWRRDLVVVGASAGGVAALPRLLQGLPRDLPAAVVLVLHLGNQKHEHLIGILSQKSPLPVAWAEQGAELVPGKVWVAPPDHHAQVVDHHLMLSRGPRENHVRPSIDKLFRSAAAHKGSRCIAALLTGTMFDGVGGLQSIRDVGGVTLVQDPVEAAFPDLPTHALEALTPDHVLPLDALALQVRALAGQVVQPREAPPALRLEAGMDERGPAAPETMALLGPQVPLSCPDCSGPLWELGTTRNRRYRCYLGHAASARDVLGDRDAQVELALWSAVRALNERARTLETLARDQDQSRESKRAQLYAHHAREARDQAERCRQFILELKLLDE